MRPRRLCSALLLASAALISPLAAQTSRVTVRVVEEGSGSPLPGMGLVLRGTAFQGTTGADGTLTWAAVPRGSHALELRDGSGQPHESRVTVRRPVVEVTLRLRPGTTALEPLVVTAMTEQRRATRAMGARRDLLDREFIEANAPGKRHVGELLRGHVPGLRVSEGIFPGDQGQAAGPRLCIETNRRHLTVEQHKRACWMVAVYLDGMRIADPGEFLLGLRLEQLESVEMLTPTQATIRYGTNAGLGVLEIYTRGNGPHARRPGQ